MIEFAGNKTFYWKAGTFSRGTVQSVAALPCVYFERSTVQLYRTLGLFNVNVMQYCLFTVSVYQKMLSSVSYVYTD